MKKNHLIYLLLFIALTNVYSQGKYGGGTASGYNMASASNLSLVVSTPKYLVSGLINNEASQPVNGVTIAIAGASASSTQTNVNGLFSFANLNNGVYVITPTATTSYTFSPASRTVTVNNANITIGLDFVAVARRSKIIGNIKDENNLDVANLTLQLSGLSNTNTQTVSNGSYTFSNLLNGTYVVTPVENNSFTFTPTSRTVTLNGANISSIDFTAVARRSVLSGTITDEDNLPLENLSVQLSGFASTTVSTNSQGVFLIPNLMNGSYTITLLANNSFTFSPQSRTVTLNGANISTGLNFTGIYKRFKLTGKVKDEQNQPLANFELQLSGNSNTSTLSVQNGDYSFDNLKNGTYTITPTNSASYTFNPSSRTVTLNGASVTSGLDFVAVKNIEPRFFISGKILDEAQNGVDGLTVQLSGGSSTSTLSKLGGSFTFSNLTKGNYVIMPLNTSSFTYTPVSRTITINNADIISGVDFVAVKKVIATFSIEGTIIDEASKPVAGLSIQIAGSTNTFTQTNTNGKFKFSNLSNGNYTITPTPTTSYTFTPTSQNVQINGFNVTTGTDFIAIAIDKNSIEDEQNALTIDFEVYPNPSFDKFDLKFKNGLTKETYFKIFDTSGKMIIESTFPIGVESYQLDFLNYGSGVYYLETNNRIKKLVKK